MDPKKIERINELAHKAKAEGLTKEELAERHLLRKEYLASIKTNLRATLDSVVIEEADGSQTHLKKLPGSDHRHHHHHDENCGCGHHHDHHVHDENCGCGHDHDHGEDTPKH